MESQERRELNTFLQNGSAPMFHTRESGTTLAVVASMQYQGVLLDIDGTLVDSNGAHVHAWVEVLRGHGFDITPDDIWPLIGMGGDNLLPRVVGIEAESEQGERISKERSELFKEKYLPGLKPFPQVR